jgi:hypothetical protein
MTPTLSIELRGQTFIADEPTDSEIMALASLFLPGDSEVDRFAAIRYQNETTLLGYDISDQSQLWQASALLATRLTDPAVKAKVAYNLLALFPDLPSGWVRYRLVQSPDGKSEHDFRFKLSNTEALEILLAVMKHLVESQKNSAETIAAKPQGFQSTSKKQKQQKRQPAATQVDDGSTVDAAIEQERQQLAALNTID